MVELKKTGTDSEPLKDCKAQNDDAKTDQTSESHSPTASSQNIGELGLPLPENHSPLPIFVNLVRFFEGLSSIKGEGSQQRRRRFISGFIKSWKKAVGNDIYPVVQLWFPNEDDQLKQLGQIKEQQIGKMLVEALDLPPKSPDALALSQPRRIGARYYHTSSNADDGIASKARQAIKSRYAHTDCSRWRINEITAKLVKFTESKRDERVAILRELIENLNSEEMYWVIRIMLRNLSLNCSEKSFLNIFHKNAVQVYMVNKNLKTVCQQLWSPEFVVSEADTSVHLMSFFCPMRAKFVKGAADDMEIIMNLMRTTSSDNSASFFIEEKIDGDRVQLHWKRDGNVTKFLSRKGTDYTDSYRGIFNSEETLEDDHFLDKTEDKINLSEILSEEVYECILDGEIVAYDPETNDICGQSKVRELTTHQRGGSYRHMMFVFDIVLVNGEVLTETALNLRKKRLEEIIPVRKRSAAAGRIQILPYKLGHTAEDIAKEFRNVVGEMSEGLVVKNPNSKYELDGKTNSWVKVKPEYVDGYQGEHLDLIVVGCSRGSGRLRHIFASYLCALVDEKHEGRFVAFTKVGSGICLAMYEYISGLIDENCFAQSKPPEWLDLGNESPPDFYIEPEKSIVIEVKYSEISSVTAERNLDPQSRYGVGYSLRFPRYVRLRDDKDVNSALTVADLLNLCIDREKQAHNMVERQAMKRKAYDTMESSIVKRIQSQIDNSPVEIEHDFLNGQEFIVCGDIEFPKYLYKIDFERLIKKYGGSIAYENGPNVICLADRRIPKAAELMLSGNPILHPKYLFDCIDSGRLLQPEPSHFFFGAPKTTHPDLALVDRFGFSLYRTQSHTDIEQLFNSIDVLNLDVDEREVNEASAYVLKGSYADDENHHKLRTNVFFGYSVYIDPDVSFYCILKNVLIFGSANLTSSEEDADYIVTNEPQSGNTKEVSTKWVFDLWNSV